jgi:hypothetical protein
MLKALVENVLTVQASNFLQLRINFSKNLNKKAVTGLQQ